MDFSIFDERENFPALTWLGNKDWVVFNDLPAQRAISALPREIIFKSKRKKASELDDPEAIYVYENEHKRHRGDLWGKIRSLREVLKHDVLSTLWYLTLSKALAGGPKLFRPTWQQCQALELTDATFPFEMYKQPFPVVILEIPKTFQDMLIEKYHVTSAPSHVLIHHNDEQKFISLSAFYNKLNIITHVTPDREEYATIEDSIVKNRERRMSHGVPISESDQAEFTVAEVVQRLGMNFAMMMTMLGTKIVGPLDPRKLKELEHQSKGTRKGKMSNNALRAIQQLQSQMYLIKFTQEIDFYDELAEDMPIAEGQDIDALRKSPRTHWRRGHWRQQPYGPRNSLRRPLFMKPKLIRAQFFTGDHKDTSVTYEARPGRNQSNGVDQKPSDSDL